MACLVCILFVFYFFSQTGATESGIVGGKVSKPHSRPYMVSLQIQEQHICGGILIRKDFVLTAAHCKKFQPLTVVLGAHNISKKEKSQQLIQVGDYYPHPDYYTGQYHNDIMLIKLKSNAKLNKYVKAIGLPKKNGKVLANVNCVVAGWGQTQPGDEESTSDVLKETNEKVQCTNKCEEIWQWYFDNKSMICTTFDKEKGGICQGDSGGPIICKDKLQGLTAYTYEDCNDPKYPHVFTKIHFFLPWIKKIMWS